MEQKKLGMKAARRRSNIAVHIVLAILAAVWIMASATCRRPVSSFIIRARWKKTLSGMFLQLWHKTSREARTVRRFLT